MLLPFHPGPRRLEPEIIDQPDLAPERLHHALRGLERINFWSGSSRTFWKPLLALARELKPRPLRLLDVGCGGGDVLRKLRHRSRLAGWPMALAGCDRSPVAIAYAEQQSRAEAASLDFFTADVLREDLPGSYDAVICSLFLHHFSDEQAVVVLRRMAAASSGLVLVNDLRRSLAGWLLAKGATRVLTSSLSCTWMGRVRSLRRGRGPKFFASRPTPGLPGRPTAGAGRVGSC